MPSSPVLDLSQTLLIVVGAHPQAETSDRPLAYGLLQRIRQWLERSASSEPMPIRPLVLTDLWYMNHASLQKRPTISLGAPGVNALSAYYWQRRHKVTGPDVADSQMVIQIDPEYIDLRVCVWGRDQALTEAAVTHFSEHYLDTFLRAVATQVEPRED